MFAVFIGGGRAAFTSRGRLEISGGEHIFRLGIHR